MNPTSLIHTNLFINNICDKGCPNCFYPKGSNEMTKEDANFFVDWFLDEKIDGSAYFIDFLGGEPLNSFDKVILIMDLIIFRTKGKQKFFGKTALLNTNGDFLTKEILQEMKARSIGISLNPTNDSIPDIKRKISLIKSVFGGARLAIVMDEFNCKRIKNLTEFALENHLQIRTNRLYAGGKDPEYIDFYKKACLKMLGIILKSKNGMNPFMLIENIAPIPSGYFSDGRYGYFSAVDHDGTIRGCSPDVEYVIGNIRTHKLSELEKECKHFKPGCKIWDSENLIECHGCSWEKLCRGGCAYTRKLTYGTYDHKSPFCEAFKELFPLLMELTRKYESYTSKWGDAKSNSGLQPSL